MWWSAFGSAQAILPALAHVMRIGGIRPARARPCIGRSGRLPPAFARQSAWPRRAEAGAWREITQGQGLPIPAVADLVFPPPPAGRHNGALGQTRSRSRVQRVAGQDRATLANRTSGVDLHRRLGPGLRDKRLAARSILPQAAGLGAPETAWVRPPFNLNALPRSRPRSRPDGHMVRIGPATPVPAETTCRHRATMAAKRALVALRDETWRQADRFDFWLSDPCGADPVAGARWW